MFNINIDKKKTLVCSLLAAMICTCLGGLVYYRTHEKLTTTMIPKLGDKSLSNTSIIIESEGKKVNEIKQITTTNIINYNEKDLQTWMNELKTHYNEYKGVRYSAKIEDKTLTETIKVDMTKATADEVEVLGITIDVPDGKKAEDTKVELKLKDAISSLEDEGYKVKE